MSAILIVESSGLLSRLVGSLCSQGQAGVIGARTFKAAVDALQRTTPSAILVDLDLPGKLDVEKACLLIKRVPRCKDVPLFLIGEDGDRLRAMAGRTGAAGYFVKPVTPARFRAWFQSIDVPAHPPAPALVTGRSGLEDGGPAAPTGGTTTEVPPVGRGMETAAGGKSPGARQQAAQAAPVAAEGRPSGGMTGGLACTGEYSEAECGAAAGAGTAFGPPGGGTGPGREGTAGQGQAGRDGHVRPDAPPAILLVDAGTGVIDMLREAEVYKYCAVVAAGSAQEAGVMLKIFQPAAIVVEAELPDLRGEALCRFLKSVPEYEKIPVFLTSSRDEDELEEPVILVGASGFLRKPFDGDEFVMFLFGKGIVSLGDRAAGGSPSTVPGAGEERGHEGYGGLEAGVTASVPAPGDTRPGTGPTGDDRAAAELARQLAGSAEEPGGPVGQGASSGRGGGAVPRGAGETSALRPPEDSGFAGRSTGRDATNGWPGLSEAALAEIPLSGNLAEQVEAILDFGRRKDPSTVPVLIHILSGGNPDLIGEACWSLGEIGDRRAVPELVMILKRPETFCVLKAVEALGKIADPSAVPHIVARAADCGDEIKLAIVRALDRIGDTMACKGLEILSLDENFAVATMAGQALKKH